MAFSATQAITCRDEAYLQAVGIVSELRQAGFTAYLVGGCVRDLLLGLTPKDYDVATDAKPQEVQRLFPEARGFGQRFGVSVVPTPSGDVEVAAFREDGFYYDHRRPAWVNYAGVEEDARRRDFTLNALYYDPAADRILDLVGGLPDLQERWLRIIGDPFERFDEDWLRLLRAVRFAARFALRFDYLTWDALRAIAPLVNGVSAERRTDEVRLMLQGPNPGRALGLLRTSGLWRALWPDLPFSARRIRKAVKLLKKTRSRTSIWKSFFADLPRSAIVRASRELTLTRPEKKSLDLK